MPPLSASAPTAAGILAANGVNETLIALPLAIVVSALFALATGYICLRTKGVHFIMITLAFGQMAFFTASSLAPYGGDDGLTVRTRDSLFGIPRLPLRHRALLRFAAGVARRLSAVPLDRRLAVRPRLARRPREPDAHGRDRLRGLSLISSSPTLSPARSAALPASCSATRPTSSAPPICPGSAPASFIIMVVLGGIDTLYGAIIGAAAFVLTEEWLPGLTEQWKMIFGPLLVLVVLFARGGLIGLSVAAGDGPWRSPVRSRTQYWDNALRRIRARGAIMVAPAAPACAHNVETARTDFARCIIASGARSDSSACTRARVRIEALQRSRAVREAAVAPAAASRRCHADEARPDLPESTLCRQRSHCNGSATRSCARRRSFRWRWRDG